MPTKEAHYSFVRTVQSDPRQAAPSLRLYHSLWSEERALLSCAWSDDAAVIRSYLSLCQERTDGFSDHQDEHFDTNFTFAPEEMCVSVTSPGVTEGAGRAGRRPVRSVGARSPSENPDGQGERSGVERHRRVKRGFIVPGTLWCGSGNKAPSYADLGKQVQYIFPSGSNINHLEAIFLKNKQTKIYISEQKSIQDQC